MNINKEKEKIISIVTSVNWLEIIYLTLFAAFVIGKFLETTALQWELPADYNAVIRVLLCVFIQISFIAHILHKGRVDWFELALMLIMASVGYMVSYHVNEIFIFDTMLLIIGAKNIDYRKICYVYICIAVVLLGLGLYLSGKGAIPDYVYQSERGIRHSLGSCYATEFMAHIFFLFAVYICFRGKRITFFELVCMVMIALEAYRWTYARNSTICILVLCLICACLKALDLLHIRLSDYKLINILSLSIVIAFVVWLFLMSNYNSDSSMFVELNEKLSDRINLSAQGYQTYGITAFGSIIQENGWAFGGISVIGQYFCLDVYFVRVLIKYGYLFAIIISVMYIRLFTRMRAMHKDYILAVLIMLIPFGMVDFQVFSVAYNPLWLLLFAKIRRGRK